MQNLNYSSKKVLQSELFLWLWSSTASRKREIQYLLIYQNPITGLSIVAALSMMFLFGMELNNYLSVSTSTTVIVDQSPDGDFLRIKFYFRQVHKEGKHNALFVSFVLGIGSLIAWGSMMSIGDYFYTLFTMYHPARTFPLVYQLSAIVMMAFLKFFESKIDARVCITCGYSVFLLSICLVFIIDLTTSGRGGLGSFIGICLVCGAFGLATLHEN